MVHPSPGARWLPVEDGLVVFVAKTATFIDLDDRGVVLFNVLFEHEWDLASSEKFLSDAGHLTDHTDTAALHRLVDVLSGYGFFDVEP